LLPTTSTVAYGYNRLSSDGVPARSRTSKTEPTVLCFKNKELLDTHLAASRAWFSLTMQQAVM
jgi:hypothetical protein